LVSKARGNVDVVAGMSVSFGERTCRASTEDLMNHDSGVIQHPKFRMWLRPDGIVEVAWASRTAVLEAMAQLTGGQRRPLLVDMHDTGSQDRDTRAEWTSRTDLSSAVALIVGTPLSRMIGHLFLRANKPPFPVKLFRNEASALAWLSRFVD
jgi:hypothetical protein